MTSDGGVALCSGALNIRGKQYRCEQERLHGSGCSNKQAGAVWASGSNIDAWGSWVGTLEEQR